MRKKLTSIALLFGTSASAFSICEHELSRYKSFKSQAEDWGHAAMVTMGAGSFLGALGGLIGAAPAAVAARYDQMASEALVDYHNCLKRAPQEAQEQMEAAARAEKRRITDAIKKEKDSFGDI